LNVASRATALIALVLLAAVAGCGGTSGAPAVSSPGLASDAPRPKPLSSITCNEWRDMSEDARRSASLRYVPDTEAVRFALAIDDKCRRLGALADEPTAPASVEEVAQLVLATGRFEPLPGVVATPEPRATGGPGQPVVGGITFGTSLDGTARAIEGETTRFKATYRNVAWVAILAGSVGSAKVEIVVARKGSGGAEREVLRQEVDVGDSSTASFADQVDLTSLLDHQPGTYVMRYLVDGAVAAEGEFELVK
jgi:hypothetical protein